MNNDAAQSDTEAALLAAPTGLPTLGEKIGEWLGFQLPALPSMPQTLKNLDKVGAALLDLPAAALERTAGNIRAKANNEQALDLAIADAMRRELAHEGNKQIAGHVRGLLRDYLQKHHSRRRVLEVAVKEIAADAGTTDAHSEPSDDFMAFFKGKADNLGTDEARTLFGKVLAGEVRRPGSFSKPAMTILAELDREIGSLFETLCNMSAALLGIPTRVWKPRVLTLGLGNASENALKPFGLGFDQLNILNEAGLIIGDYNSYAGLSGRFELAGQVHQLTVDQSRFPQIEQTLNRMHGVAFTRAGSELRAIVSMTPNQNYVTRLRAEFLKFGITMT